MKDPKCPVCGKGDLVKTVVEEKFEYKGKTKRISNYVVYRCSACEEEIVDKASLKKAGRILNQFKNEVDGLLSAEEIKKIRTELGFTQRQMADLLGGGAKSFARYETGAVRLSKPMDNLLRILARFPSLVMFFQGKPEYLCEETVTIDVTTRVQTEYRFQPHAATTNQARD